MEEEEANDVDANLLEGEIGRWKLFVTGRTGPLDRVLEEEAIDIGEGRGDGQKRVLF